MKNVGIFVIRFFENAYI